MDVSPKSVYELRCSCNSYPWGKQGKESLAARLCENGNGWSGDGPQTPFKIEDKPYAEMWMGTYPELPAYVAETGEDLQTRLDTHPKQLVGDTVINKFGHNKLPFLPKVLSIAKALPLQLHPNKDVATELHKEKPDAFTDPNHKPEIAIALSEFEAFCGFKPLNAILSLLELEPLKRFMPSGVTNPEKDFTNESLREVVRIMLSTDEDTVKQTYSYLVNIDPDRYTQRKADYIPKLARRLAQQYDESDPGILVALITMNYLVLQPGEAIYIPADGIHAYISGDIIECMARSNNVLNTGFCPRAERSNVDLFCKCLTFTPHSAEDCMLKPRQYEGGIKGKTKCFAPPLSEFSVLEMKLEKGGKEEFRKIDGPAIMVVTEGSARMKTELGAFESFTLKEGSVFYIAKGVELQFTAFEKGLVAYVAFADGSQGEDKKPNEKL